MLVAKHHRLETSRLWREPWSEAHTEMLVRLSSISGGDALHRTWSDVVEGRCAQSLIALNFAGAGTPGLEHSEYEIGWWLDPGFWIRGLAREGVQAIRDEALGVLRAPSLVARIKPENASSIRAARSVGLVFDFHTIGRGDEPVAVYRLRAADWAQG